MTSLCPDRVNLTVSSTCPGAEWYRSGWRAGLLWSGVALLLLLLLILAGLLVLCLCPALCPCLPCCARRAAASQHQVR